MQCIHSDRSTYIYTYICIYILRAYIYIYKYIYTHLSTQNANIYTTHEHEHTHICSLHRLQLRHSANEETQGECACLSKTSTPSSPKSRPSSILYLSFVLFKSLFILVSITYTHTHTRTWELYYKVNRLRMRMRDFSFDTYFSFWVVLVLWRISEETHTALI